MRFLCLKNVSIKWKLFFFLLLFCSVLLAVLWIFQVVLLDSIYKNIKIGEVKNSATAIVSNIGNDNLKTLVDRISSENDVCIEIITQNGQNVYTSHILPDCIIHRMAVFDKLSLYARTISEGGELLEYYDRSGFRDSFYQSRDFAGRVPPNDNGLLDVIIYSRIMTNEAGEASVVLINSVVSPVSATVKTLRYELYFITAFMLIFAVVLAFIIARHVSRPIVKLTGKAAHLSAGDYDADYSVTGYKEIEKLSSTLGLAAAELDKVEHLRRELIANISHDLRTPLSLISGYAQAMRDLPGENTPENAQIIVDEVERLTALVGDVLNLSKLQSGVQSLNVSLYSLTQNVMQMITRLNELVRKDGYLIELLPCDDIYVHADESRISQAVYNLLTNAVNYTGEDKRVYVCLFRKDGRVWLEVRDTGEGIPDENITHIWERYYRSESNHKRAVTGSGLGLSIVKQIITMHGGEYGVISALGEGSTFYFNLPI